MVLLLAIVGAPPDQGPIYTETNMSQLPVEPWATFTNLLFLGVVIYWAIKTKFAYRSYPLLTLSIPILFIGWLGGTVYHATRSHRAWLIMDYLPIAILVMAASVYFWEKVCRNRILTLVLAAAPLALYRLVLLFYEPTGSVFINIGYGVLAASAVLPVVLHCGLRNRRNWYWLLFSFLTFCLALAARVIDRGLGAQLLPMGTHFLWHTFGALSTFFIMQYLYTSEAASENNEISH